MDVNLLEQNDKYYIEILVSISTVPITYHGVYHYRSGSIRQELRGIALQNLLLRKLDRKWEDMAVEGVSSKDLNETTLNAFLIKAIEKERVPSEALTISRDLLLRSLGLVTDQGDSN